jgi:hypothetical protein
MRLVQTMMLFATHFAAKLKPPTPHASHPAHAREPAACAPSCRTKPGSQETLPRGVSREPGAGVALGRGRPGFVASHRRKQPKLHLGSAAGLCGQADKHALWQVSKTGSR